MSELVLEEDLLEACMEVGLEVNPEKSKRVLMPRYQKAGKNIA
jgi:hypothetical protein